MNKASYFSLNIKIVCAFKYLLFKICHFWSKVTTQEPAGSCVADIKNSSEFKDANTIAVLFGANYVKYVCKCKIHNTHSFKTMHLSK